MKLLVFFLLFLFPVATEAGGWLKIIVKGVVKGGIKMVAAPVVLAIDVVEITVDAATGNFFGATVGVVALAADVYTLGAGGDLVKGAGTAVADAVGAELGSSLSQSILKDTVKEFNTEAAKGFAKDLTVTTASSAAVTAAEIIKNAV